MAYKSGNPILSDKSFNYLPAASGRVMTLDGTVNKTMFLLVLLSVFGTTGWIFAKPLAVFILPAMLVAFGIAVILSFKRSWSPALAPVYALLEGTFLGFVSRLYDARFAGIVVQAIGLTLAITLAMLFIYKTRTIKVTQNFRLAVTSATIGIALLYVIDIAMHYFGTSFHFISGGGVIGIGFSLLVVGLAALNLVMDFDFIERGADQGVPKYMEWYSAFGLIVTLVWLYLEMLRLLGKARS